MKSFLIVATTLAFVAVVLGETLDGLAITAGLALLDRAERREYAV